MSWRILQGDAIEVLRTLPEASARTCITSPPYFGLRDYGTATWSGGDPTCAHRGRPKPRQDTTGSGPDKGRFAATRGTQPAKTAYAIPVRGTCSCGAERIDKQIGVEPTVDEYVGRILEVMEEVRRVLKEDGTLWLNLGDCYASDAFGGSISRVGLEGGNKGHIASRSARVAARRPYGLSPKQLIGVPWRVAFALQEAGWTLRADVIWAKPNPMPESVQDRPTKAHEYLFLFSKNSDTTLLWRARDTREWSTSPDMNERVPNEKGEPMPRWRGFTYFYDADAIEEPATGRAPGNVSHKGATAYESGDEFHRTKSGLVAVGARETRNKRSVWTVATRPFPEAHFATFPPALVRPCILAGSRPGDVVIDPFCGAATVGLEAQRLGRDFIGCDLSADYVEMGSRRIVADAPLWNTPATEALS